MKHTRLTPSSFFATTQQIEQWLFLRTRPLAAFITLVTLLVWFLH